MPQKTYAVHADMSSGLVVAESSCLFTVARLMAQIANPINTSEILNRVVLLPVVYGLFDGRCQSLASA